MVEEICKVIDKLEKLQKIFEMSFVDYIKEEAMKVYKTFEDGGDPLTYVIN